MAVRVLEPNRNAALGLPCRLSKMTAPPGSLWAQSHCLSGEVRRGSGFYWAFSRNSDPRSRFVSQFSIIFHRLQHSHATHRRSSHIPPWVPGYNYVTGGGSDDLEMQP